MTSTAELIGLLLMLLATLAGGLIWLVRLEQRVEVVQQRLLEHISQNERTLAEVIVETKSMAREVNRLGMIAYATAATKKRREELGG